ncbi:RagB/SusD family nutrient uptake outer membrane protein [Pedobacter sp. B4-66]|uniref:RagB/SusD family nutrient uptake outer membrane protein n=1 Tax=Pedobacter sp. B4-66 TaxID=2817280 RepID=UPI0020250F3D|nr:RagB/SusD family nutrient uptake outer membrane protein [Pedobacter sp. B4-66]
MKSFNIKLYMLSATGLFLLFSSSCKRDFLEKPNGSDVTIDTIFSSKIKAETFLWNVYGTYMPNGFSNDWNIRDGMQAGMLMAASDEGDIYDSWPGPNSHNEGNWGPQGNNEDEFGSHYKGIRNASIFLENVDRVPDISATEKDQMKAEAIFLRALQYAELVKRYGGVPLVDKKLEATGSIKIPRSTYEECVNFIVKSCDEVIASSIPDSYPTGWRGRINRGAALALKSRVLLYAASPLSNGAPYLPDPNNLTGYGSYDERRWVEAAKASKAVLDWAAANGVSLVKSNPDAGVNYESAISQQDNPEIILANKSHGPWGDWSPMFQQFVMPRGIYGGWYGNGVTLQMAQMYQTATGEDQNWPAEGSYQELMQKMQQMEPRFQQSVAYSGSKWNDEIGTISFYKKNDGAWSLYAPLNGVGYMKKFLTRGNWGDEYNQWIIFRLAEFYLNYAEALNEHSAMDPASYDALNMIRERAGMPRITSADPNYNSQEKLRKAIRRERAVELAFEEHRFFDVRRWKIAGDEGVMKGKMWGLNLYEQPNGSMIYKMESFESRVWQDKMYVYPMPQTEIDKGYVTQTPGW